MNFSKSFLHYCIAPAFLSILCLTPRLLMEKDILCEALNVPTTTTKQLLKTKAFLHHAAGIGRADINRPQRLPILFSTPNSADGGDTSERPANQTRLQATDPVSPEMTKSGSPSHNDTLSSLHGSIIDDGNTKKSTGVHTSPSKTPNDNLSSSRRAATSSPTPSVKKEFVTINLHSAKKTEATRQSASTPLDNLNLVAGTPSSKQQKRRFSFPSWSEWKARIPNYITYLRLVMVPVMAASFCISPIWAPAWFGVATVSDFLDGYLARKWQVTSDFGAFLDPVADKLLVSTCLILLSSKYGMVVAAPTAVIVAREVAVSALREWMAQRNLRNTVKVSWQGKLKTASTMFALFAMLQANVESTSALGTLSSTSLLADFTGTGLLWWNSSLVLLYVSAILTVTSGAAYFRAAASALLQPSPVPKKLTRVNRQ